MYELKINFSVYRMLLVFFAFWLFFALTGYVLLWRLCYHKLYLFSHTQMHAIVPSRRETSMHLLLSRMISMFALTRSFHETQIKSTHTVLISAAWFLFILEQTQLNISCGVGRWPVDGPSRQPFTTTSYSFRTLQGFLPLFWLYDDGWGHDEMEEYL